MGQFCVTSPSRAAGMVWAVVKAGLSGAESGLTGMDLTVAGLLCTRTVSTTLVSTSGAELEGGNWVGPIKAAAVWFRTCAWAGCLVLSFAESREARFALNPAGESDAGAPSRTESANIMITSLIIQT